jgi:ABC-type branched-subunit amino acid transport system substrate-binding protein
MARPTRPLPFASCLLPLTLCLLAVFACTAPRKTSGPIRPNQPAKPTAPARPAPYEKMDTLRWTTPANPKPPIKNAPGGGGRPGSASGNAYHIAYLLPFLSAQAEGNAVPEKSRMALQFYAGAKIALEQISREEKIHLVADVYDTQSSDADFQKLMADPRLDKPALFIGPVRNSHLAAFAEWAKPRRKIVISPESPTSDLTRQNPDFIQTSPSLRAHCEAIVRHIRKTHRSDAVTLVCKEKEADRLPYFQNANALIGGGGSFSEWVLPDATASFSGIDLKKYIKPGRTSVFVLPTWASQDFVNAFLRKLRESKGANHVEVYGMPQWRSFESIEPEFFSANNVHVTAGSHVQYAAQEVRDFQQKFYDATGTIPDNDGFNGYDVTLFTGRMLARYGLAFPEQLSLENYRGLHGEFRFAPVYSLGSADAGTRQPDYLENTFVHILKFGPTGFVPAQ